MSSSQAKMLAMLKKRKQDLAAPSVVPAPASRLTAPAAGATREKRSADGDVSASKKSRPAADSASAPAAAAPTAAGVAASRLPSLTALAARSRAPGAPAAKANAAPKAALTASVMAPSRKAALQAAAAAAGGSSAGGVKSMQQQMEEKLKGAQFRWLNEKLYTTTSAEAVALMESDPSLFEAYHSGFRHQVTKWPVNPVDIFTAYVRAHPSFVVGDFGCGDAQIARSVTNTVHSFDLVAVNDRVTACDIRKTPLENGVLDVAIFSLALMGTNLGEFIQEAHRTLKMGGSLKIAEVRSRFDEQKNGIPRFIAAVEECGFKHKATDTRNTHFVLLDFIKTKTDGGKEGKPKAFSAGSVLKPCIYKRR